MTIVMCKLSLLQLCIVKGSVFEVGRMPLLAQTEGQQCASLWLLFNYRKTENIGYPLCCNFIFSFNSFLIDKI